MKIYACLLLFACLISSCSTIHLIDIHVQRPAQKTFPESVQNIVVVNNAVVQPENIGHTTIEYTKQENVRVSGDSVNIILTQALAQFMNEEQYFNRVTVLENFLREDGFFLSEVEFTNEEVKEICEQTSSDAIISLDRIIMLSELTTENIGNSLVSDVLKIKIDSRFRIYNEDGLIFSPLIFRDSLEWETVRHGNYNIESPLPSREEALKLSALHMADKMVYRLIPYWEDQTRFYYSDAGSRMKQAAIKAANNDWRNAALIWGELFEKEKKDRKKTKLALNIALANEMLEDIENALIWVNLACVLAGNSYNEKERERYLAELYKEILEERDRDFKVLIYQDRN